MSNEDLRIFESQQHQSILFQGFTNRLNINRESMQPKLKYIRTEDFKIITFSEQFNHKEFAQFKPVSAGFLKFKSENDFISCVCYGSSDSLNLTSDPFDTELAMNQILGYQFEELKVASA